MLSSEKNVFDEMRPVKTQIQGINFDRDVLEEKNSVGIIAEYPDRLWNPAPKGKTPKSTRTKVEYDWLFDRTILILIRYLYLKLIDHHPIFYTISPLSGRFCNHWCWTTYAIYQNSVIQDPYQILL